MRWRDDSVSIAVLQEHVGWSPEPMMTPYDSTSMGSEGVFWAPQVHTHAGHTLKQQNNRKQVTVVRYYMTFSQHKLYNTKIVI